MFTSKSITRAVILLAVMAASLLTAGSVVGQDSLLINYQGYLTDGAGDAITSELLMTFAIYDAGGVSKWFEVHPAVEVENGLFTVILGSHTALPGSVFDGSERYLGISVEGADELSPRTLLTSSPGAAVSRRVVGDILTAPGSLEIYSSDEPCVPPDPCQPALEMVAEPDNHVLRVHPPDPCVPPEPCAPAFELIADAEVHSFKIHPPEPCDPAAPCAPAFEVTSQPGNNTMKMDWGVPPDDSQPAFELVSDATLEQVSMQLLPPPDDNKPGINLTVDAAAGTSTMKVGGPPPDDNKPSVEITSSTSVATLTVQGEDAAGTPPQIVMAAGVDGASLCVGTNTPSEALTVMGNGWFSGDVFVLTDTRVKTNIRQIDGALDKVSALSGYYYDFRTDEFPEFRMPATPQIGLLAQEVRGVLPEVVRENQEGLSGVSYSRLTAVLVEAVKELKAENEDLRVRIEALEQR